MKTNLIATQGVQASCDLPKQTGISLKPCYYKELLEKQHSIGFVEIHAENYLSLGGPRRHFLELIRQQYPITVHGVGLSIGGNQPLNTNHLERIAQLVNWSEPLIFSEHLAWSSHGNNYYNDLLPVSYDAKTLERVCQHVEQVQNTLKQTILIENPSNYLAYQQSTMSECQFLSELVTKTGCHLLLDINNVVVSSHNLGYDAEGYLNDFPIAAVKQFHLAGHSEDNSSLSLKIDSHDEAIDSAVWSLYAKALSTIGDQLTLIERDGNLPPLTDMLAETEKANNIRQTYRRQVV